MEINIVLLIFYSPPQGIFRGSLSHDQLFCSEGYLLIIGDYYNES